MDNTLRNNILDAFAMKSSNREKKSRDGETIEYKFITFSEISEYIKILCLENNTKFPGPREIKRRIIDLIEEESIVEVFGEPPIYLLSGEFDKYRQAYEHLLE